jgi:hypothetical protein
MDRIPFVYPKIVGITDNAGIKCVLSFSTTFDPNIFRFDI